MTFRTCGAKGEMWELGSSFTSLAIVSHSQLNRVAAYTHHILRIETHLSDVLFRTLIKWHTTNMVELADVHQDKYVQTRLMYI